MNEHRVSLYTADGAFIETIPTPHFTVRPSVIVTTTCRVFKWDRILEQYRECMAWFEGDERSPCDVNEDQKDMFNHVVKLDDYR